MNKYATELGNLRSSVLTLIGTLGSIERHATVVADDRAIDSMVAIEGLLTEFEDGSNSLVTVIHDIFQKIAEETDVEAEKTKVGFRIRGKST